MNHKTKPYTNEEECSPRVEEAVSLGYPPKTHSRHSVQVPKSHTTVSFSIDVPADEDIENLKLRLIAFAEYLSYKEKNSVRSAAIRRINKLTLLEENWDGYGSPQIDPTAAMNARDIVSAMDEGYLNMLHITPTETGSISLRLKRDANDSVGINCERDTMSYFIEKGEQMPDFYSNIAYTQENIQTLMRRIEKW